MWSSAIVLAYLTLQKLCYIFQVWRVLIQESELLQLLAGLEVQCSGSLLCFCQSDTRTLPGSPVTEDRGELLGQLSLQHWRSRPLMLLRLEKPPLWQLLKAQVKHMVSKSSLTSENLLSPVCALPLPPENSCDDCDSSLLLVPYFAYCNSGTAGKASRKCFADILLCTYGEPSAYSMQHSHSVGERKIAEGLCSFL